jgi:hypothetical protein
MFGRHLLDVPGALRLVVDDDVLRWRRLAVAEVLLDGVLDVADEGVVRVEKTDARASDGGGGSLLRRTWCRY